MPDPLSRIPTPDLAAVYFAAQCLWMGDDSAAQSAFYAALADELRSRLGGMMGEWLEWRRGHAQAAGPQTPPPPPPGE